MDCLEREVIEHFRCLSSYGTDELKTIRAFFCLYIGHIDSLLEERSK